MDEDVIRSCYHSDAVEHHGSFHGDLDAYVEWVMRLLRRYSSTEHIVGQTLVEFSPLSADVARVETVGLAVHQSSDGDPRLNLDVGFRYLDRFERRPSADAAQPHWRIAQRVATTEWVRSTPPERWWPVPAGMVMGRRDGTDPVQAQWDGHPAADDWPWSSVS